MAIIFVQAPQEFQSSFLKVMSERGFIHQITDAAGAHNPDYPFCKLPRHSTLLHGGFFPRFSLGCKTHFMVSLSQKGEKHTVTAQ